MNQANEASARPVLYIDMDNTLVDFVTAFPRVDPALLAKHLGNEDDIPGIFALMDPMPGAVESVVDLASLFDTYVLSTAPWANPTAWHDKVEWIQRHFGAGPEGPLYKRLILSHHKHLNRGEFLVDDRPHKNGAERFHEGGGEVIHFGSDAYPSWPAVVSYLKTKV